MAFSVMRWGPLPRRVKVAFAAEMPAFLVVGSLYWLVPGVSWELHFAIVVAWLGGVACPLSIYEVARQARPHPAPRMTAKGWAEFSLTYVPVGLFVLRGDAAFVLPVGVGLLAAAVAYEATYRRIVRARGIDEVAVDEQLRSTGEMVTPTLPRPLRAPFAVVLAGAAVLALSIGPGFLTLIPAVWMVALFIDPDVPMDERFCRRIRLLAAAGLATALAGTVWGTLVPAWNFGALIGVTPLLMAVLGVAGAGAAFWGARLADRGLASARAA